MKDYNFYLAAGGRTDISGPIRSVRLMSTSGAIALEVGNNKSALVAGRAIIFDAPIDGVAIINEGASDVDGVLALGASSIISDNILTGEVSQVKPSTIDTVADVALTAAVATLVLPADITRREALISNLIGNASNIRVGDVNTGAARGAQCGTGQTVTLNGTEAIYAFSATAQSVGVTTVRD